MTREIIHPTPLWQKSFTAAEWGQFRNAPQSRVSGLFMGITLGVTLFSLFSYADRRCLYVYQKHDPRKVELPWENDFKAAHQH